MVEKRRNEEGVRSELLKKLVEQAGQGTRFDSIYLAARNPEDLSEPYSILASLGLRGEELSDSARAALEATEELVKETGEEEWLNFRWKLSAFHHLQDIFDTAIQPLDDPEVLFQQYYFYFESRVVLAESVLAGLNGLYAASDALLRPFLEFSLLQNYYYRIVNKIGTYSAVEEYFEKGKPPTWNTVLRNALPNDSFSKPIRFRIQKHLQGLSESTSHPYHPDHSALQHRPTIYGHSLEGLFFWAKTRLILDAALWVYYINFPLLLHPVDILRKFGFSGPVGVVVDSHTSSIIKQSLTTSDYESFREYSGHQDSTVSVLEWVSDRPDLTDEEIRDTWPSEDGPLGDLWEGYCRHNAKFRALRMAMAFRPNQKELPSEKLAESMFSLEGWKRISKVNRGGRA